MANNGKKDRAERWVLYVGRKAFAPGKWVTLILLVLAAIMAFMLVLVLRRTPDFEGAMYVAYFAAATVMCVLLAHIYFERRHFYRIIKEQKEKIAQLEKELRDAK